MMITFPNAKINIGLNITARRPDGYHNLETIFYPVKVYDSLEMIPAETMHFDSSGIGIPGPSNGNLCLKAYAMLAKDFDLPPVKTHLHKHIPIGAGLGGGSSDAAFFLKIINQEFSLKLGDLRLQEYARQLGADCAFFINNKPAYATGKGDEFEPLELDLSAYCLIVVMPPVKVSTAEAYRDVKPLVSGQDLRQLIKLPIIEWKNYIQNHFEESVFPLYPVIKRLKNNLYGAGAAYASMSGSGASVFGFFEKMPVLDHLEKDHQIFICSPI